MSLLDSIKEFFGGSVEDLQNTVAEHVNVDELGQKAEEVQQSVGETVGSSVEDVTQKVDEAKERFTGGN